LILGLGLAVLAYGGLATASGLDRMSATRPDLATRVPAPFAAQALRIEARRLLDQGQSHQAQAVAEAALTRAPLDPESPALLGLARLTSGDDRAAERAFTVAGKLGWRVPSTQAYWLDRALAANDYPVAAMRLDALLRQRPALLDERRLLDPLERNPAGQEALAARMSAGPGWLGAYSSRVAGLDRGRLLQRAGVLEALARRGVAVGCEPVSQLVEALVNSGAVEQANATWRHHCPGAAAGFIHDPRFASARIDQDRSQFAWTFLGHGDVSLVLEPGEQPGTRRLAIESSAAVPRLVVRQLVLLEPGPYRLTWRTQGAGDDGVLASLTCSPNGGEWLPARRSSAGRMSADAVLDGSCPARWLGFAIASSGKATLGDVTLERLAQATTPPR
jgi:hypothetical protein